MKSYTERQVLSEPLLENLSKRPLLLIAVTASLSFGIQLIPFKTVSNSLLQSLKALSQDLILKKLSQWLLAPPLLLAFVCLAILFTVYTSQQGKPEFKFDDDQSVVEPTSRGLLYRTATLGQSIFTHFFSHAEDDHVLVSGDATPSYGQDLTLQKQANVDDNFLSTTKAEMISVRSAAKQKSNNLANTSGKIKKLTRPATSTVLASEDRSIPDQKLPKSFRDDPLEIGNEELDRRFEAYLRNFRRQLELQKQESLMAKGLRGKLNSDSLHSNKPSPVDSSLLLNDIASSDDGMKEPLSKLEDNMDLTETELNERIDAFLSGIQNSSGREMSNIPTPQHRKWHSNSYSAQYFVDGAASEPSTPDLTHSSSRIVREDSLAIDNQKFEAFLQNFRNELKLQQQKSNLRQQLHRSQEN